MKEFKKTESLEEFLARGGSVKKLRPVNDLSEIKSFKKGVTGGEVYTKGRKGEYGYAPTSIAVGSEFFRKHPWKNNGK